MDDCVFDGEVRTAYEARAQGRRLLCPRPHCRAELIFAPDLESANRHRVHPGIHCPVDQQHCTVLFNLRSTRDRVWRAVMGSAEDE
jgi:hypothetical protein